MNTPTMETIYRGSGAVENLSSSDCPAIQSFKTAGECRLAAGKSKINGLVFAAACVGMSFATASAGAVGYVLATDPDVRLASLAGIAIGGLATIFTAATAGGLLKNVMERIEADTKIMFGLKLVAKEFQDKNIALHLRASLKDAAGAEGEAAGERGTSPAATVHGINAKTARRFQ